MGQKFANFSRAKLATPPSGTGGLSFSVQAGKGALFPTFGAGDYAYGVFTNATKSVFEVVKIEARSTDAFTIATASRGIDGTTAQTWTANDYFYCSLLNIGLQELFNAATVALGALTPAANKVPYFTSGTAAALADFSSFGRSLVDDADAAAGRTTLNAASLAANTFTASQTVNGTSGTVALTSTGSGTGDGISSTGGATNGRGIIATGVGTGIGGDFVGGSGSANAHGSRGTAVHVSAGGVAGFSQNGSFWGVLGYQNTYGMYSNGLARVVGSIQLDGGVVYLNSAQTRFLQWASDQYTLSGAPLSVTGIVSSGSYFQSADAISLASAGGAEGLVVTGGVRVNSGSNQYGQYVSNATWTLVATVPESTTYDVYSNHGRGIYVALKSGGDSQVAFLCWEQNSTFTMSASMGAVGTMGAYRYLTTNFTGQTAALYKVT